METLIIFRSWSLKPEEWTYISSLISLSTSSFKVHEQYAAPFFSVGNR